MARSTAPPLLLDGTLVHCSVTLPPPPAFSSITPVPIYTREMFTDLYFAFIFRTNFSVFVSNRLNKCLPSRNHVILFYAINPHAHARKTKSILWVRSFWSLALQLVVITVCLKAGMELDTWNWVCGKTVIVFAFNAFPVKHLTIKNCDKTFLKIILRLKNC